MYVSGHLNETELLNLPTKYRTQTLKCELILIDNNEYQYFSLFCLSCKAFSSGAKFEIEEGVSLIRWC